MDPTSLMSPEARERFKGMPKEHHGPGGIVINLEINLGGEGAGPKDGPPCVGDPRQLLEAISLIDTATDGVLSGGQKAEDAIKEIDAMTSRILWGKQDDSEETTTDSYQNANYSDKVAAGLMMDNKADLDPDEKSDPMQEALSGLSGTPLPTSSKTPIKTNDIGSSDSESPAKQAGPEKKDDDEEGDGKPNNRPFGR